MHRIAVTWILLCLAACQGTPAPAQSTLPYVFDDVATAPPAVQAAAKAIVRISGIDGGSGVATGFFARVGGICRLLTNNHVLGAGQCPKQGCVISLTRDYRRDGYSKTDRVLVVPRVARADLDIALLDVWYADTQTGGPAGPYEQEVCLDLAPTDPVPGEDIFVVGHPAGCLMKSAPGQIVEQAGDWFVTSAYILPGNSGSPVIGSDGAVRGIVHHSEVGPTLARARTLRTSTQGTPVQAIAQAIAPDAWSKGAELLDLTAVTTADDAVAGNFVYLAAGVRTMQLQTGPADLLDELAQRCDAEIAKDLQSFATVEAFDASYPDCNSAWRWISCALPGPWPAGRHCPSGSEKAAWLERANALADRHLAMHGVENLGWRVSAQVALEPDADAAAFFARSTVTQIAASQPLSLRVASWLLPWAADEIVPDHGQDDVIGYVLNYPAIAHYEVDFSALVTCAWALGNHKLLSQAQLVRFLDQLRADDRADVGDRLSLEAARYHFGGLW